MGDPNKGLYLVPRNYGGRILNGYYSVELKRRLVEIIERYQAFEDTGSAGILYVAAWQSQDKQIWYEYTSQSFLELLDCRQSEVADVFRNCVVDRRIYKTLDMDVGIHKEVQSRAELEDSWKELREECKKTGTIEAVYKIHTRDGRVIWVKDQANIEFYFRDRISLSLGLLTVVSKEMEAEDELKRHHDHLESMVLKRTSELMLLNKQLKQEIVERKLAEYKLKQSNNQLENNLDEMVRAMSLTVEERDPYTAGHQRRATELAVALAREMGLSNQQCKSLRMAGLIHDMGKIAIPAEILSKPGGLNIDGVPANQTAPAGGLRHLEAIRIPRCGGSDCAAAPRAAQRVGLPPGAGGGQYSARSPYPVHRGCGGNHRFPPALPAGAGPGCRPAGNPQKPGPALRPPRRRRLPGPLQIEKLPVFLTPPLTAIQLCRWRKRSRDYHTNDRD